MASTLPHNEEAEVSILGSILINPTLLETATDILSPSDFYSMKHQSLFKTLIDYSNDRQIDSMDMVTLINHLKSHTSTIKKGSTLLDDCGGVGYISSLTNNVVNTSSLETHCNIVKSLSRRRDIIVMSQNMVVAAYDESRDVNELLITAGNQLSKLEDSDHSTEDRSINPFLGQALQIMRDRMGGIKSNSIETGFYKLDNMTDGGFHPTDFIIIAARPSIGKTAFCTSIIQNMIMNSYSVAFFSLEMSGVQVSQRLISGISKVPLKIIKSGRFLNNLDPNFRNVFRAAERIYDSKLYICDTPNMRLSDIRATARKLKREKGIQAIFIDYIGLVDAGLPATVPRHEQVSYVSRNLKAMARDLELPVIVLCQVSRDAEGEKNEPQLNNLRDSGAIEQDADMVMFLHRSRNIADDCLEVQPTKVILAKQRNGETGEFKIGFKWNTACFENLEE